MIAVHQRPDPETDSPDWPPTLESWRSYPRRMTLRNMHNVFLWKEMIPSFVEQGVIPYTPEIDSRHLFWRAPPKFLEAILPPGAVEMYPGTRMKHMQQIAATVYPALLSDGTEVMLKVVSKRPGVSPQLSILRFLSQEPQRSMVENHAIPILREVTFQDWTFVAMPRYGRTGLADATFLKSDWFVTVREMFDFVHQSLEAFAFLHDHLIAHQDIAEPNFVMNLVGHTTIGYLSAVPIRYYVVDFEHAIQFPQNTTPEVRRRVGPPGEDFAPDRLAPEIGEQPHCPFAADAWQLGLVYFRLFSSQTQNPTFRRIIASMISPQPEERPSLGDALNELRSMLDAMSDEALAKEVTRNYLFDRATPEEYDSHKRAFLQGNVIEHVNRDRTDE
ncbi:hypothetical protein AURDEDRAFT_159532 [Auricularia subglabra TFB-10046 SS5]|nr:hypothetical protein AURDEDRAFT_159532 [Auricularia subglabra TFB-10046 SS5]